MGRLRAPSKRKSLKQRMRRVRETIQTTNQKCMIETENIVESPSVASIDSEDVTARSISEVNDQFAENEYDLIVERMSSSESFMLSGRRIVDINSFFNQIVRFKHLELFSCGSENLHIVSERRHGLQSDFILKCSVCSEKTTVSTDNSAVAMDINKSAVLGTLSTGGGYSQLREFLASCNVPAMGPHMFVKNEQQLSSFIHDTAWELIEAAGKEEAELALAEGRVDCDNVPLITVVADGAWSKRSYKTNYNAASGVGVIVGQRTGKVIFMGVRNKYCCVCARAKSKNSEPPTHQCFKNWDRSSTAMESDIILEGFMRSIEMHGVKYAYLVGDGDSSITKRLGEMRPYANRVVQKIECKNHLLRNFCNKLRELTLKRLSSKKITVPLIQRNYLKNVIKRLRSGIQGAVKFVIDTSDLSHVDKLRQLKKDILNAPSHVFGDHMNCSSYFCKGRKSDNEKNWLPEMKESGLYQDVMVAINRVARNTESLILNMDNNAAEWYNSIVAKFVSGKRINFSSKGSYQTRCEAASVAYNSGPGELLRHVHKKAVNSSPGKYTKRYIYSVQKNRTWKKCRRSLFPPKRKACVSAPADSDYGAVDDDCELSPQEFLVKKEEFLNSITKTVEEKTLIQKNTVGQSANMLWRQERSVRLTASNFGNICKLRKTTNCANLIKTLCYSNFSGNRATQWGKDHESVALKEFEEKYHLKVEDCGLYIDIEHDFLAASPDGLVGKEAIVEVKCPYTASNLSPLAGVLQKKIKFAELESGQIKLKRTHNYYFQVQGQLKITGKHFCYFIIWTPHGLNVEKIFKDEDFWKRKMEKQIICFFNNCFLPEIVDPQHPKNRQIRDLR